MEPEKVEGSSGTRNLSDNLSDLKAQVAANQKARNLSLHFIVVFFIFSHDLLLTNYITLCIHIIEDKR